MKRASAEGFSQSVPPAAELQNRAASCQSGDPIIRAGVSAALKKLHEMISVKFIPGKPMQQCTQRFFSHWILPLSFYSAHEDYIIINK